jgi:hypothetical protein
MTQSPRFRMYSQGRVTEVGWHEDPANPTEIEGRRRSLRLTAIGLVVVALVAILAWFVFSHGGSSTR